MPRPDPTRSSLWQPLFELIREMDAAIEQLYADAGHPDVRSRFVMPLVRLSRLGPMSIKTLASECAVTHSAMSQTVAALRKGGYVEIAVDPADGRARVVELTARAAPVVDLGEREWAATEASLAELEAELPYAVTRAVGDVRDAFARRGWAERLQHHLGQG